MILLCDTVHRVICKYRNLFASKAILTVDIHLEDGVCSLNGFAGVKDDTIFICANDIYNDNILGKEVIFNKHVLTSSNTFAIDEKYVTQDILNTSIITDFRIYSVVNETVGFEIFKNNPNNYIFIVPSHGVNKNIAMYSDVYVTDYYDIIIMLNNKNDINQAVNTQLAIEIRNYLIAILHKKYKFTNSEFVFGTQNTTILKNTFGVSYEINNDVDDVSHVLNYTNSGLHDSDNSDNGFRR